MALHMKRKCYHWLWSAVAFIVVCLEHRPRHLILYAGVALAIFFILEIIHLRRPDWDWLRKTGYDKCLRPHEKNWFTSSLWLALGFFLVVLIFREKEIILLAVAYAGFCDPFAEIAGHHFRTPLWPNSFRKTLGGSLAFFLAGLIASGLITYIRKDPQFLSIATFGSLAATYFESRELIILGIPFSDNLLVPVLTAVVLKLFFF